MKTIHLHIGMFKTGTTAIQRYCHKNRDILREQGLLYPASLCLEDNGHVYLPSVLLAECGHKHPSWLKDHEAHTDCWEQTLEEIESSDCSDVLLSNEHFCHFAINKDTMSLAMLVADILSGYQVRAVVYLRRVDHYYLSWYNQLVKMGAACLPLEEHYSRHLKSRSFHLYQSRILDTWSKALDGRLDVHSYDLVRRDHGDVVRHLFGSLIPCDISTHLPTQKVKVNRSLGHEELDALICRNLLFKSQGKDGNIDIHDLARRYAEYLRGLDLNKLTTIDINKDMKDELVYIKEHYLPEIDQVFQDEALNRSFRVKIHSQLKGRRDQVRMIVNSLVTMAQAPTV